MVGNGDRVVGTYEDLVIEMVVLTVRVVEVEWVSECESESESDRRRHRQQIRVHTNPHAATHEQHEHKKTVRSTDLLFVTHPSYRSYHSGLLDSGGSIAIQKTLSLTLFISRLSQLFALRSRHLALGSRSTLFSNFFGS